MNLPIFQSAISNRVSVGAKVFLVAASAATYTLIPSQKAFASTNSTWSSQPSWATSDSASNSRPARSGAANASSQERYSRPVNLSPFSPGSNNVSLEMGQVFLMGDLSDRFSDSIGTAVHYTYGVSDVFAFDSRMGYSNHADGKFSMFSFQAGLRTNLAWYDKVIPYAAFGLGFYKPSYSIGEMGLSPNPNSSLSPMLFGVHLGPGVDLEVTKQLFFGASLTFQDVFGKTETTSEGKPFDVGGTFTSFFLHAGVTF